jgi:hypothetical protein
MGVKVHLDVENSDSIAPLSPELIDLYAVFWNVT